jgi:hypothetical protein
VVLAACVALTRLLQLATVRFVALTCFACAQRVGVWHLAHGTDVIVERKPILTARLRVAAQFVVIIINTTEEETSEIRLRNVTILTTIPCDESFTCFTATLVGVAVCAHRLVTPNLQSIELQHAVRAVERKTVPGVRARGTWLTTLEMIRTQLIRFALGPNAEELLQPIHLLSRLKFSELQHVRVCVAFERSRACVN